MSSMCVVYLRHCRVTFRSRCPQIVLWIVLGAAGLCVVGCGREGPPVKAVYGTVTIGGQKVETGRLRFVPIDGTKGPISTARITDGQYRIDVHGGVPLGRHRAEVDARKRTGRTLSEDDAIEAGGAEETARIGPDVYAGPGSPLTIEVTADSDGKIDIQIPKPHP